MAPAPGLVIFDCDGVLVDSEPISIRVLLETLSEEGLDLDASTGFDRFLGRSLSATREILAADFGLKLSDAALGGMRQRLYAAFRADLCATPGIHEALAALTTPVCVASSSQPARIRLSLEVTGLLAAFEGRIFSATMVPRGKPAPDLFLFAAESMGYDPAHCLVVEDSPVGIRAARRARMRVAAFCGGSHAKTLGHREAVVAQEPDWMFDHMRELPHIANSGS